MSTIFDAEIKRINVPHATKSPINCGVIVSRNSQPAGIPSSLMCKRRSLANRSPLLIWKELSVEGAVD